MLNLGPKKMIKREKKLLLFFLHEENFYQFENDNGI